MGLFGSTKIYVASTVRNMAGDEADQPNYMKTVTVSSVMSGAPSIADSLRNSYIKGPGIQLRNFFRWSLVPENFSKIGVPGQILYGAIDLDGDTIGSQITAQIGKAVSIQSAFFGGADYSEWSDQYILNTHPELLDTNWTSDISEAGQITITYADGSIYSFMPDGFDRYAKYIYTNYMVSDDSEQGPTSEGSVVNIGAGAFPSTAGYVLNNDSTSATPVTLTTTVVTTYTYSDGRPVETNTSTSSVTGSVTTGTKVYTKSTYLGTTTNLFSDDSTKSKVDTYNQFYAYVVNNNTTTNTTTEDVGGGVTRTKKVDTTTQSAVANDSYRMDTRTDVLQSWRGPYVSIYKYGSGNTVLDGLIDYQNTSTDKEFFPFVPIRLDNLYITQRFPDAAEQARKGFKKSVGGDLDKVISQIDESPNVADIDYAYAVFGVSLNVKDRSCKKYIYRFLQRLATFQASSLADYQTWKTKMTAYQNSLSAWLQWKEDQGSIFAPGYGDDEPKISSYPVLPSSSINIKSNGEIDSNYNIYISWQTIAETSGTGLAKADAKVGDVWFEKIATDAHYDKVYYNGSTITTSMGNTDHARLYWQVTATHWTALDVYGLAHQNFIYGGKSVDIGFFEALDDAEESGFILPLHYPTLKSMSLTDSTQMTTACTYLVFNSYVVKKTGLLGSLFFKIFLIVVIIAVVVFAPQLAPGLVHAAAATGAAIGLSGLTALIVGAAVNAIAGMIVASLLQKGLVAIFGDSLGSILGAVIAIAGVVYGSTDGFKNFDPSNVFSSLSKADNILRLTDAVTKGVVGVIAGNIKKIAADMEQLTKDNNAELKNVADLYAEYVGTDLGKIDPTILTDSGQIQYESRDSFISRTLLSGSDVAQFSMYMVENFTDYSLSLELP